MLSTSRSVNGIVLFQLLVPLAVIIFTEKGDIRQIGGQLGFRQMFDFDRDQVHIVLPINKRFHSEDSIDRLTHDLDPMNRRVLILRLPKSVLYQLRSA
jgi:hypothetical protein